MCITHKLVIKYSEFVSIPKYENNTLYKIDIETLKYGDQIGLETLVVHTVKYEYWIFISSS